MSRTELPRDTPEEDLDYHRLISTLESVVGDPVVVRLSTREVEGGHSLNVASIVGELRHHVPARYEDHEFSIGSPYPDRYPEHLAGGVLFLNKRTFQSATLTTFDGNDYFSIVIETSSMQILLINWMAP